MNSGEEGPRGSGFNSTFLDNTQEIVDSFRDDDCGILRCDGGCRVDGPFQYSPGQPNEGWDFGVGLVNEPAHQGTDVVCVRSQVFAALLKAFLDRLRIVYGAAVNEFVGPSKWL